MPYYKVCVRRISNTPRYIVVTAAKSQDAIRVASLSLREEGITDARAIEVISQVSSLRG